MPAGETQKLYTRAYALLMLSYFFLTSGFGAFFLFPLFISEHGGSKADIGILMGAFALSRILCRPWISEIIDRAGRKKGIALGGVAMTLTPLLYLFFHGDLDQYYLPLLLLRLIHGVGLAFCFTAPFTFVSDITPVERLNEGMGMFGVAGLAGMAFGPLLGEIVWERFGSASYFCLASLFGLLGLLTIIPLRESYSNRSSGKTGSFFSALKSGKMVLVTFISALFGIGITASNNFVTPFASFLGVQLISLYFISYSAIACLTRLFGGKIADRIGERKVIPYAIILMVAGMLALSFLNGITLLCVAGALAGCGHGFLFPCLNTLAIRGEAPSNRGKVTGLFTGSIDLGDFVGAVSLGYLGEAMGFRPIFSTAAAALLIALVVYLARVKRLR